MDVRGRIAVVTGAGSGIGRATAIALAKQGATMVVTDISSERLSETCATIEALGSTVLSRAFDVSDRAMWVALRDELVRQHGGIHVLVNNAGVALTGPFLSCAAKDLEWQLDVNLRGVMYGCHVMLPVMVKQDAAHLVNISSLFGLLSVPDSAAYCMSKHAVKSLSHSLMMELPAHVGVTSVHPGAVATRITADQRFRTGGGVSERGSHAIIRNGVSPENAAARIVDAIIHGRERVIIGRDAHLLAALRWLMPESHRRLIKRWRKRRQARYRSEAR